MSAATQTNVPACADECVPALRQTLANTCAHVGAPVTDVHITHVPPLTPTEYEDLNMRCPHGVLWHMQPTSEQIAKWAQDSVE